jgi:hypothetical protein
MTPRAALAPARSPVEDARAAVHAFSSAIGRLPSHLDRLTLYDELYAQLSRDEYFRAVFAYGGRSARPAPFAHAAAAPPLTFGAVAASAGAASASLPRESSRSESSQQALGRVLSASDDEDEAESESGEGHVRSLEAPPSLPPSTVTFVESSRFAGPCWGSTDTPVLFRDATIGDFRIKSASKLCALLEGVPPAAKDGKAASAEAKAAAELTAQQLRRKLSEDVHLAQQLLHALPLAVQDFDPAKLEAVALLHALQPRALEFRDGRGCNALMMACMTGFPSLVALLCSEARLGAVAAALVAARDSAGDSALHYAVDSALYVSPSARIAMVKALMAAGCAPVECNVHGVSALDVVKALDARQYNQRAVLGAIFDSGKTMAQTVSNALHALPIDVTDLVAQYVFGLPSAVAALERAGAATQPAATAAASAAPEVYEVRMKPFLASRYRLALADAYLLNIHNRIPDARLMHREIGVLGGGRKTQPTVRQADAVS